MSGTLRFLLLVGALVTSSEALAFDFDAEIAKQNKIYGEVTPTIGNKETSGVEAVPSQNSDVKVVLISKK